MSFALLWSFLDTRKHHTPNLTPLNLADPSNSLGLSLNQEPRGGRGSDGESPNNTYIHHGGNKLKEPSRVWGSRRRRRRRLHAPRHTKLHTNASQSATCMRKMCEKMCTRNTKGKTQQETSDGRAHMQNESTNTHKKVAQDPAKHNTHTQIERGERTRTAPATCRYDMGGGWRDGLQLLIPLFCSFKFNPNNATTPMGWS